jgi:hypothetical protein
MNCRPWGYARFEVAPAILALLISAGFAAVQVTLSAGPLLLHQVRSIYLAPSSDDLVSLVKARLEKWNAVGIVSKPEEADAILTCQTATTMVPAKVVVWRTIAEVALVDRRSQKPIWKTTKSATYDTGALADDIVEQLKKDWRTSPGQY